MKKINLFTLLTVAAVITSCGGKSASDYQSVEPFENGYAIASVAGNTRQVIVDENYEPQTREWMWLNKFSDNYWYANNQACDTLVIIDSDFNETLLPYSSRESDKVSNSAMWFVANTDGKKGIVLIDFDKKEAVTPIYENCTVEQILSDGTAVIKHILYKDVNRTRWDYAMVDNKGNEIAPIGKYTFIGDFNKGLAPFSTNGYGEYESTLKGRGDNVKQPVLAGYYGSTSNGETPYHTQGYINEKGEIVIPQQYCYATAFSDEGVATVAAPQDWGHTPSQRHFRKIDINGEYIQR